MCRDALNGERPEPDSETVSLVKKGDSFFELFTLKRVIDLQMSPECLIGLIQDVIYLPNRHRIIILDSQVAKTVLVFDADGKFIRRIGSTGDGVGDYRNPTAIAYEDGKLAIVTKYRKVLWYKLNGRFIKEVSLSARGWTFDLSKICIRNGNLYAFDYNEDYDTGLHGNKHDVFRLTNYVDFDRDYGQGEKTMHWSGGGIVVFDNRIVYSHVFDGNIYQIKNGRSSVFASLGPLTDVTKYSNVGSLLQHFKQMDEVNMLAVVDNLLFVRRQYAFSILNSSGQIIRRSLPIHPIKLPSGFEGDDDASGYHFYTDGMIFSTTRKSKITGVSVPNPSLLIYQIRK